MSRYLIERIENHPKITLHYHTEIVALEGEIHLEEVHWRNKVTGEVETQPIRHVFLMTGAVPNTAWLQNCLALDDKGFILTGHDLPRNDSHKLQWPGLRSPMLLETSLHGIFAVGDARSGNLKRVASVVGEGSISIHLVHRVMGEM
jgi:thioredoxin reductase (NADPH)